MLDTENSIETSIGTGLLEGYLRESKTGLIGLANGMNFGEKAVADHKLLVVKSVQTLAEIMRDPALHTTKLSFDKASDWIIKITPLIGIMIRVQGSIGSDKLAAIGRVISSLNKAKDQLQEVINELQMELDQEELKLKAQIAALEASQTDTSSS